MPRRLALSLDAVIVAVTADQPRILTASRPRCRAGLPSGLLDADGDGTLELGLRRWIRAQTGLAVGYVEQLYTFGDRDRQPAGGRAPLSVAYLGLVKEAQPAPGAAWIDAYDLLPWEDRRAGLPAIVSDALTTGPHALGRPRRGAQAPRARELRGPTRLGPDPRARALRAPLRNRPRSRVERDRGRRPGDGRRTGRNWLSTIAASSRPRSGACAAS